MAAVASWKSRTSAEDTVGSMGFHCEDVPSQRSICPAAGAALLTIRPARFSTLFLTSLNMQLSFRNYDLRQNEIRDPDDDRALLEERSEPVPKDRIGVEYRRYTMPIHRGRLVLRRIAEVLRVGQRNELKARSVEVVYKPAVLHRTDGAEQRAHTGATPGSGVLHGHADDLRQRPQVEQQNARGHIAHIERHVPEVDLEPAGHLGRALAGYDNSAARYGADLLRGDFVVLAAARQHKVVSRLNWS